MALEYVLITALFAIGIMIMIALANDMTFMYFQHLALPVSLPIP
ncbi:MAG: hypothetical protein AMXMBFR82_23510 [Candidatus Hydrogenedentota bacterium]